MITEVEKIMNEAHNKGWAKGCLSVAVMKLEAVKPYVKGWQNESIREALEYLKDAQERLSE
jgi:hypothetical protein